MQLSATLTSPFAYSLFPNVPGVPPSVTSGELLPHEGISAYPHRAPLYRGGGGQPTSPKLSPHPPPPLAPADPGMRRGNEKPICINVRTRSSSYTLAGLCHRGLAACGFCSVLPSFRTLLPAKNAFMGPRFSVCFRSLPARPVFSFYLAVSTGRDAGRDRTKNIQRRNKRRCSGGIYIRA